ncbi:hypothetical protein LWC35_34185 [Pseudonocardia kujensis]|uniref:hypothetical protein n=1 Tax=Pseudonocardia kujensis TaxID=1128675 RepID=UPI001E450088|nr:hypothetical protein [Pseudonocardia kujensis]MCE0767914.1 hypothetical protein [Pseudonocardia kujensis]
MLLSGPQSETVVPPRLYQRLAADLRANGVRVVADLAGERMEAVVEACVDLLKVGDEESAVPAARVGSSGSASRQFR